MSIFKEHKTVADRSASDRRRHRQKIEKAIKEGIHDIVAEESIIGQDGKKKIRIPVRGNKEYKFIYGNNESNPKVGSAPGKNVKKGQQIGKAGNQKPAQGEQAGNESGEEYYDIEITLDELADYLFSDLELPELEKKKFKNIVDEKIKRHGYRSEGIRPRLDKKKTAINRIKRKAASSRNKNSLTASLEENEERFPYHKNDLKYRHFKISKKESSNAVIFFIMDISGSMTKQKKFLARSFYFLLYQFLRSKYENTDIVFISHDTIAHEVNEEQFFTRGNSGGTIVSSGLEKALYIINQRYHPNSWNVYCFQCSDGDNWPGDEEAAYTAASKLKSICQLYGYCEIDPVAVEGYNKKSGNEPSSSVISSFQMLSDKNFKICFIFGKEDIWDAFTRLFGGQLQ